MMHHPRSVCIMPTTFSQANQEHLYQCSGGGGGMNNYDRSSSMMRTNSMKSDSFGGAGTVQQFTLSRSAIGANAHTITDCNYDFDAKTKADADDNDDGIKYLDNINRIQQHSTIYLHSNDNMISDKNVAIGPIGYRSHSPRSSISDSGSSISNSNSNSSTNNNNRASFPVDESIARSFSASSREQSNNINDNYVNDVVNNNEDDDDDDWINSNSNVNVSGLVNYSNYIDNNYANNNQPNRRNHSRTSRRTSSLRVYH